MKSDIDVIIVGGGMIGLSVAYWLTKKNKKVLVLEKTETLAAGSSGAGDGHIYHNTKMPGYHTNLGFTGGGMYPVSYTHLDVYKRQALADLFQDNGVLHDSSVVKAGMDTLHLEGKMAIEMMFHHKFGFNGGPFKIKGVRYVEDRIVWYFITYNNNLIPASAFLEDIDENGKIKRLDIYPL